MKPVIQKNAKGVSSLDEQKQYTQHSTGKISLLVN